MTCARLASMLATAKRDIEIQEQRLAYLRARAQLIVFACYRRDREKAAMGRRA